MALTTGVVETKIPRRLDRLPWSRWHWYIVVALGTVWILDGLEVTIKGAVGAQLTESLGFSTFRVGALASIYIFGAISGALVWGFLTDRFGRRLLFMITLSVYMVGVVGTALAGLWELGAAYMWFGAARFLTGFGIGGEYAAVNSAIDELMPARVRGHIALTINGSWWVGTMIAAALGFLYLNVFPANIGWRVAFGQGIVIAFGVLLLRRYVPESPRWLITHGRQDEADQIMRQIERSVEERTGESLPEPADEPMRLRMRRSTGFLEIAKTVFVLYPRRAVVGFSLFVAQAFLYNAVLFTFGLMLNTFYDVPARNVGLFLIPFGAANFLGVVVLGRFFDTWGRRVMIPLTFLLAGTFALITGWLFTIDALTVGWLTLGWAVIFFFATAGASSAYLTVSETFPMEIRAMVIAFFYAIGTAAGGIAGPLLYGALIATETRFNVFLGYLVAAGLMIVAGLVHRLLGVEAGQQSLEDIAAPLSVEEAREQERERGPAGEAAREEPPAPAEMAPAEVAPAARPYSRRTTGSGLPMVIDLPREDLDIRREADIIVRALAEDGPASRNELSRRVRSRYWGPGRFRRALRLAVADGRVERADRGRLAATAEEERIHQERLAQERAEHEREEDGS